MDWAQILVIILTILFVVFLAVTITLAVMLIKVTRQIKEVTASAERTVHAFEDSMSTLHKSAFPLMMAKKLFKQVNKKSKIRKGD